MNLTRFKDKWSEKAQTTVEFALVVPVLLLFILGIIQFAVIYAVHHLVQYSAYNGCRVGIVNYDQKGYVDLTRVKKAVHLSLSPLGPKFSKIAGYFAKDTPSASRSRDKTSLPWENLGSLGRPNREKADLPSLEEISDLTDRYLGTVLTTRIEIYPNPEKKEKVKFRRDLKVVVTHYYHPFFGLVGRVIRSFSGSSLEGEIEDRAGVNSYKVFPFIPLKSECMMPVEIGYPYLAGDKK